MIYDKTFIKNFYQKATNKVIILYKYQNNYYDINKTIFKDTVTKDIFKIIAPFKYNNNDVVYVKNINDELDTYKININDFIENFIPIQSQWC